MLRVLTNIFKVLFRLLELGILLLILANVWVVHSPAEEHIRKSAKFRQEIALWFWERLRRCVQALQTLISLHEWTLSEHFITTEKSKKSL